MARKEGKDTRLKPDLHVRCPEGKVVTQQLHDQRAVLVRLLSKGVKLCNGLIKGLHIPSCPGRPSGSHSYRQIMNNWMNAVPPAMFIPTNLLNSFLEKTPTRNADCAHRNPCGWTI